MLDYIVVGLGLAGTAFCETLRQHNKSFIVFENKSQRSSRVAGGLSNPVILKRFTVAWNAPVLLPVADSFYTGVEGLLEKPLFKDMSVYRRFASIAEQNLWFEACDKSVLNGYLSQDVVRNKNTGLKAPFDFGKVKHAKHLDTVRYLDSYAKFLRQTNNLMPVSFSYDKLLHQNTYVAYGDLKAKHIVFAEGFGLMQNPFFNYLPMQGSKGEYLIIKSEDLHEENAIKSALFIIPLGNHLYKVGANYDRNTTSMLPTEKTKLELIAKLDQVLGSSYEIIDQEAGIRPTVKDRRPLVGQHPQYNNMYVLNGYGSHGIMISPWAALQLYEHIEFGKQLFSEMNCNRFSP